MTDILYETKMTKGKAQVIVRSHDIKYINSMIKLYKKNNWKAEKIKKISESINQDIQIL